jgi:uncharacterized protein
MNQRTYPHGVPCWIDTEQPDVEAATGFYAGLFGWTFEDVMPPGAPGRYLIARLGGEDVAGLGSGQDGTTAWNTYVSVDDADAAVPHLVAAGATVLSPPADAGEGGRSAALADTEGAGFRLWQAKHRPGAQVANQPGTWNFSDLHTTDPEAAIAFYGQAFRWQVDDIGYGLMVRRPGYGDHLEATVDPGIRSRQADVAAPPGFEDAIGWLAPAEPGKPDHWHVTFAVEDRDTAVALAERLGATVVSSEDTDWTKHALIRDPQGAELTLSQFTPPGG